MNSIESEFRLGALPRRYVPERIRELLDEAGWTFTLEIKRRSLLSSRYLLTLFYGDVERPTSL